MRGNFSRSASIKITSTNCYTISCTFVQYTTYLQVTTIHNSLITTQQPAHNAQRTLEWKIIRPVSARKARGPGFSGPAWPGPRAVRRVTISNHVFKILFSNIACFWLSYFRNSFTRAEQPNLHFNRAAAAYRYTACVRVF